MVRGPGWSVPIEEGYGELRQRLRQAFPKLPFSADWGAGTFPAVPWGLPGLPVWMVGSLLWIVASVAALWWYGDWAGLGVWLAGLWPVARLRDRALVGKNGLSLGPPWIFVVPWDQVDAVYCRVGRRTSRVWAQTRGASGMSVDVPTVLLPALRARVRRLAEPPLPGEEYRYPLRRAASPNSAIAWER